MSVQFVEAGWESEMRSGIAAGHGKLRLACPFIKDSVIARLLDQAELDEITVVTRFCLPDFARGVSDIAALRTLLDAGADVHGVHGLHAKVFVFGDRRAAVTSANLTETGLARNVEFGCVSEDAAFVAACDAYIQTLHASTAIVSYQQLDDWDDLVKACLRGRGRRDPIDALPDHGTVTTPASPPTSPAPPAPRTAQDGWAAESRRAWIKFAGRGNYRAPLSDAIIDEIARSGAFMFCSYPKNSGRPRRVHDGDTMFLSRMTHSPNDMRIIGRAIAIEHDDDRDLGTSAEIADRPWLSEWPYLIRVHHCKFIDGQLTDGISLDDLMEALGPASFQSTWKRRQAGEEDVNPRASIMRKPDVRLSNQGFAWLTREFDEALARHGTIPEAELAELE